MLLNLLSRLLAQTTKPARSRAQLEEPRKARIDYESAIIARTSAYGADSTRFAETRRNLPDVRFNNWMTKFGIAFKEAWKNERKEWRVYGKALGGHMTGVKNALADIYPAANPLKHRIG